MPRRVRLATVALLGAALTTWAMWPWGRGSRQDAVAHVPLTADGGHEAGPHLRGSPPEGAPPAIEIADKDRESGARQSRIERSLASRTLARVLGALDEITHAPTDNVSIAGDVITLLTSGDRKIQEAAASALIAMGSSAVAPFIESINADARRLGRTPEWAFGWSSLVMARIGTPAVEAVAGCLNHPTGYFWGLATFSRIAKAGVDTAGATSQILEGLSQQSESGPLTFTVDAVEHLGSRAVDAVPRLIGLLEDSREQVRFRTIVALGKIGPGASAALYDLERLQSGTPEPSGNLKKALDAAILRIRGEEERAR